jgi:MFS family permease
MSVNTLVLTAGMILAGRITDSVGPRAAWGAAAMLCAAAAAIGFVLSRGVGEQPTATAEALPTALEREAAVEAQSGSA